MRYFRITLTYASITCPDCFSEGCGPSRSRRRQTLWQSHQQEKIRWNSRKLISITTSQTFSPPAPLPALPQGPESGHFTLDTAKSRLHLFLQQTRQPKDMQIRPVGPDHNRFDQPVNPVPLVTYYLYLSLGVLWPKWRYIFPSCIKVSWTHGS